MNLCPAASRSISLLESYLGTVERVDALAEDPRLVILWAGYPSRAITTSRVDMPLL